MKVQDVGARAPTPELPKGPEAARAFEAYLVGYLSKQMREAVPDGPMNSGATGMFSDVFDQEIGRLVASGEGIGLRAQLETALARHEAPKTGPGMPRVPHETSRAEHAASITSGFGSRRDPIDGTLRTHDGIDLALGLGTPVHAERSGVVRFAGERGGYGNLVILDHGGGLETRYAHCASLSVQAGDTVSEGETLGTVGSTGHSTGPHLHLEVRENGVATDPIHFVRENR